MRILILNWKAFGHPAAGGAEVYTYEIARRWADAGHEVTWFGAADPHRPPEEDVDGIRVVRSGSKWGVYRAARRYFERWSPADLDVVVDEVNSRPFHTPRFAGDVPVVALIHQVAREAWFSEVPLPLAILGRFALEPLWLRAYRDVPVVTVSATAKASLERYGLRRVEMGVQGLQAPPEAVFRHEKERTPTLLFVGRLTRVKRPVDALEAFQAVRRQHPDARLWVVGTGPLEAELRRLDPPAVTFFGRVSDDRKYELMRRAHALLATSVREGWGLNVSEAASVGTPCVGYDVAGLRDSVPACGGVLVDPSPAALASAVVDLLPSLLSGQREPAFPGGVLPWDDVAKIILSVLEREVAARVAGAAP